MAKKGTSDKTSAKDKEIARLNQEVKSHQKMMNNLVVSNNNLRQMGTKFMKALKLQSEAMRLMGEGILGEENDSNKPPTK